MLLINIFLVCIVALLILEYLRILTIICLITRVLESQTFHNTNAVDHTSKPAFTSPQSSTLPAETIVFVPDAELIAEQEEEDLLRRIQQHPVVRI